MTKKICLLFPNYKRGGAETAFDSYIEALSKKYNIYVITNKNFTSKIKIDSYIVTSENYFSNACKIIKYIKKKELVSCTPKYIGEKTKPSIHANYILRAMDQFPNKTYKFHQNYILEYLSFKFTKINDGVLDFS